ncbi:MAG: hypothetical protein JOZ73_13955, partial [Solirubrobacterales bacterium]|nr:hypothetical protein [Solirubrobacterales bacterium]
MPISLRFAGPALMRPMTRAMAHLRVAAVADPALTVHLWDSSTTGTAMTPPPWGRDDVREYGKIRGFFGDGFYCQYQRGSNLLTVLDVERRTAFVWIRSPQELPFFESAAPLRHLLALWLAAHDLQFIHAAAVGDERGTAVLLGNTGVGKSSTALACLANGMSHVGDDYCVVRVPEAGAPAASSVYCSAKADDRTLARLPFLRPMIANPERDEGEKAECFMHEHLPDRLSAGGPLRAILVPHIGAGRKTRMAVARPGAALAAAAPSTIL